MPYAFNGTRTVPPAADGTDGNESERVVTMRSFVWGTAAAFAVAATGFADDPPKKTDPPATEKKVEKKADDDRPPMEKFKEAKKDLDAKQKAFQAIINTMREKGEKLTLENKELKEAYDAQTKATAEVQKYALEAGKSDPKSKDGADALFFVAQSSRMTGSSPVMKLILEHHVDDTRMTQIVGGMMYERPTQDNYSFLETIESKSKTKETVGAAKMIRGILYLKDADADVKVKGEKLLDSVIAEYKDVKLYNRPLTAMAEGNLFEYRFLSEGKTVPEIEGIDMDESPFKLSDYRGKVVMLDFWGHW